MKGSLQGYSLCTIKTNIIRHAVETACVTHRPPPRHCRLSLSFPLRFANGDDDLCHNRQMLWHVWKVPIDMPCHKRDMMLGGGCSLGCCGW